MELTRTDISTSKWKKEKKYKRVEDIYKKESILKTYDRLNYFSHLFNLPPCKKIAYHSSHWRSIFPCQNDTWLLAVSCLPIACEHM
jgi:hypothetical protein